ncbi:MAG TPA: hypothetical protein VGB20_02935 [bacterium]
MVATVGMWALARSEWRPDLRNQNGYWNFAIDASDAQHEAAALRRVLGEDGWRSWMARQAPIHSRAASLLMAVFGDSRLSILPLLTAMYLLLVWMANRLAGELFGPRAGWLAALIVGLWPSLLLHLTQLIKDPWFIAGELAVCYAAVLLVETREDRQGRIVRISVWVVAGFFMASAVRGYMSEYNCMIWGLACLTLLGVSWRRRALPWRSCLAGAALLFAFGTATVWFERNKASGVPPIPESLVMSERELEMRSKGISEDALPANQRIWYTSDGQPVFAERLAYTRGRFSGVLVAIAHARNDFTTFFPYAGSNIDREVHFTRASDVLRYMPRALQIGLLAPFPGSWFERGRETGRLGRMLAGAETALMYGLLLLTGISLVRARTRPGVWMLTAFALGGMLLLGLVVANVGALYRIRYPFWLAIGMPATATLAAWWAGRSRPAVGRGAGADG